MTTTTLRNRTKGVVVLREGQVGVLRKVCNIEAGKEFKVRSNLTATYKEYWCALQPGNEHDKFILTSDDCSDWKEIEITSTETVPQKFVWRGTVPARGKSAAGNPGGQSGNGDSPPPPPPPAAPLASLISRVFSKVFWWKKPSSPAPAAPADTAPAASTETPTPPSETSPTAPLETAPTAPTAPTGPVTGPTATPITP